LIFITLIDIGVPGFHIEVLGDKGFYYQTEQEIINIISGQNVKTILFLTIIFNH
jgi:hypothetical protein